MPSNEESSLDFNRVSGLSSSLLLTRSSQPCTTGSLAAASCTELCGCDSLVCLASHSLPRPPPSAPLLLAVRPHSCQSVFAPHTSDPWFPLKMLGGHPFHLSKCTAERSPSIHTCPPPPPPPPHRALAVALAAAEGRPRVSAAPCLLPCPSSLGRQLREGPDLAWLGRQLNESQRSPSGFSA